jgi:hypothetical protein
MPFLLAILILWKLFHSGRIPGIPIATEAITIMTSINLNGLQRATAVLTQSGSTSSFQDTVWPVVSALSADSGILFQFFLWNDDSAPRTNRFRFLPV